VLIALEAIYIYGKFRLTVTSHAMISPSDNVLVAFSGGPSSRFSFSLSL
jgi:tRNA(Ile)-lysidine synthase TilS/MesJ